MIENQDKGDEVMYKMYMGIHMYSHHICVVYMGIHMGWLRLVGSVCIPIYKGHEVMYKNHYGEDFCEDSQQIHHDLYCIMICIASYIMIENQDKGHVGMNTIPTCPSNHYGQDVSTNYYGQDFWERWRMNIVDQSFMRIVSRSIIIENAHKEHTQNAM